MQKLILAILAATVLMAGIFAFSPIQKASTVHTNILNNRIIQHAQIVGSLAGFIDIMDASDVTTNGIGIAHVVAVLPVADAQEGVAGQDDCDTNATAGFQSADASGLIAGVDIVAGNINLALGLTRVDSVINPDGAPDPELVHNLGILSRDGGATDMCVFHGEVTLTDLQALADPDPTILTDIVYDGDAAAPADSVITITARLNS